MEERNVTNVYKIVGSRNQQGARNEQQTRYCDSKMYMVPNAAMFDDESQYEELQISTRPPVASKKKPVVPPKQHTSQSIDSVTRQNTVTSTAGNNNEIKGTQKRRGSGCIVIGTFLTALAVFIIVTLAIGALGLRGSSRAQLALDALEEDTQNHTSYLLDEIRTLNSQLSQLHADTQSNISHVLNQLANQHQEMISVSRLLNSKFNSQVTYSIGQLSSSVSSQVRRITTSVTQLSRSASQVSTSVRQLSTSASQLSRSANQASTSVSRLSTSARSISTSVYSVSTSVSRQSRSTSTSLSRLSTSAHSLSLSVSRHQYTSQYIISPSVSRLSTSVSRLSSSFAYRCTTSC